MGIFGFGKKQAPTAIDVVCGMKVDPQATAFSAEHDGRPFYFCSANCLGKFKADEERFAHAAH